VVVADRQAVRVDGAGGAGQAAPLAGRRGTLPLKGTHTALT